MLFIYHIIYIIIHYLLGFVCATLHLLCHNSTNIMYEFVLKVQPGIKQELGQHVNVAENVILSIPKSQSQTYGTSYVQLYVCQVLQQWKNLDKKKSNKYDTGLKDFKCTIWIGFY